GWRGADIRNILEFERDYPDAAVIRLEQNYRSTQTILHIANEVIRHNAERREKNLWTARGEGEPATLFVAPDEQTEAHWVVETIRSLRSNSCSWADVAVLYRTNAQSRVLEEALVSGGIPYRIYGGLRFYERKEIKDILAYLRLVATPSDDISFERVVNVPKRGIGDGTLEKLRAFAASGQLSLFEAARRPEDAGVSARAAKTLRGFVDLVDNLAAMRRFLSVTELTEELFERTGYRASLAEEGTLEAESRVENLNEFLSVTREFDERWRKEVERLTLAEEVEAVAEGETGNAPFSAEAAGPAGAADVPALEAFLSEVALLADTDLNQGRPQMGDESAGATDAVHLMTLHSAKGLEFPVVFLVGLEEGLFPHRRAIGSDREMEEERRLCYVGITRAKRKLYLTACTARTIFGEFQRTRPSRFLQEMPVQHVQLEEPVPWNVWAGEELGLPSARSSGFRSAVRRPQADRGNQAEAWTPDRGVAYRVGDKVEHRKWGTGTVVDARGEGDDQELAVAFPAPVGIKRLLSSFAPIRKLP
ncbi:MAG: ATP-binding domain-containing protein, partial [Alicyclobacillus sp.]|nr:ATP-binding domain-containing protein [Alicyclobacillus sp.]